MTDRSDDLHFLIELALDRSIEGRERLTEVIGDLCTGEHRRLSEQESDLISEILKKLLDDLERPIRQRLSEKLATSHSAPHDLIVTLANDAIEIARPLLMESELLGDPDLVEIVRHRGRQHQLAVACRRSLSEIVSEVLVEEGDEDVIKTLLENQDARISEGTMAYLVEQSKRVDSFQEPLVQRRDLPRDLAKKLYWWVAAALRMRILESFDIHPSELDDAIEDSVASISQEESERDDTRRPKASESLAKAIAAQTKITGSLLINVLRRGELPLFESLFSELSGLRPANAQRVVFDTGGEGLAIACRAVGLNKHDFATIFMLTRSEGKVMQPRDLSRATKVFDSVSVDEAVSILKTWQRDDGYQRAIQGVRSASKRRGS
jgi:uncharacterized protein (DUF2336 family)